MTDRPTDTDRLADKEAVLEIMLLHSINMQRVSSIFFKKRIFDLVIERQCLNFSLTVLVSLLIYSADISRLFMAG